LGQRPNMLVADDKMSNGETGNGKGEHLFGPAAQHVGSQS